MKNIYNFLIFINYSANQRLAVWYWWLFAGLKGAKPYDAAACDGNCKWAGNGWLGWLAKTGRALEWWAGGGGIARLNKNSIQLKIKYKKIILLLLLTYYR